MDNGLYPAQMPRDAFIDPYRAIQTLHTGGCRLGGDLTDCDAGYPPAICRLQQRWAATIAEAWQTFELDGSTVRQARVIEIET